MVTANLSISLVGMVVSSINTCYSVSKLLSASKVSDVQKITELLQEEDLCNKLMVIKSHLEILQESKSMNAVVISQIQYISEVIKDLTDEQEKIQYRIGYNKSVYLQVFQYRYGNCYKRMSQHIKKLNQRYDILLKVIQHCPEQH